MTDQPSAQSPTSAGGTAETPASGRAAYQIIVRKNGPYTVVGGIPLVHKTQVITEYGEPITWVLDRIIPTDDFCYGDGRYDLCRCGRSKTKPFCDSSHRAANFGGVAFDGAETAPTNLTERRRMPLRNGAGNIVVRQDQSLCIQSGFCGNRLTNLRRMVKDSDDTAVLSQIIAMVERCPSGSFTYSFTNSGPDAEPDLPAQIAVTTEISEAGLIIGALWVTGNIPIVRADGQPFQARNRVTLCRCGLSRSKPLCDGTHRLKNVIDEG